MIVIKVKIMKFIGILSVSAILFVSCNQGQNCESIPVDYEKINIQIERLENEMLDLSSEKDIKEFIDREPLIAEVFLLRNEYPNDSIFIRELYRRFSHPTIDSLQAEINAVFGDISDLEKDFSEAFSLMRYYYPEVQIPKIKTVATGFDYDMLVTDSVIVIGLDYYLGEGARYRPRNTYNYILKRYQPKFIVPSAMLIYGIKDKFNNVNEEDLTILSEMISYGKAFYFAKKMLPCTADSVLIWYSDDEMEGLKENADLVWDHFLKENLLWESSHLVKRKYIEERPKTYEISPSCPPRVGTWLGWEIVREYMRKNPDISLNELMEMSDAQKLFDEAKYRPK